jgi:hypothetical protein
MKTTILAAALLALSLTVPVSARADLVDAVRSLADFNGLYDSILDMAKTQNVTPSNYCESGGCEASVSSTLARATWSRSLRSRGQKPLTLA